MRQAPNERIEKLRLRGPMGGPPNTNAGACELPYRGRRLRVIFSNGLGWDHVSVSLPDRCPTWDEMAFVKRHFFHDDEAVMELHVAAKEHVNNHPYCLHLWRPQTAEEIAEVRQEWGDEWLYGDVEPAGAIPLPPSAMVGVLACGERTGP